MKAIVYTHYGTPDVLQVREIVKPTPKEHEVLVRIHAASVNSWDWDLVRGEPHILRLIFGLLKPKHSIIGSDIAGHVETVGKNVTKFQPGDEVFGDISENGFGAFAEYACVHEDVLAHKLDSMTFEQAAATPQAGVLALQGLRQGAIQQGHKVLINGAGGGTGTFAVQIAKHYGAEVTGVDSAAKLEMLKELGADYVINYRQQDFTKQGKQYNLILDMVAHRSMFDFQRALCPGGALVIVGGRVMVMLQRATLGVLVTKITGKTMGLLLHKPNPSDLHVLNDLFAAGKVVPVIDRCYALGEVGDAIRQIGAGNVHGKVVVRMDDEKCA